MQLKNAGVKEIATRAPRTSRDSARLVMRTADRFGGIYVKLLLFGPWGSGKTFSIGDLLCLGYTVYVLCTDLGGEGLNSVRTELRRRKKEALLENLFFIELDNFRDTMNFLEAPERYDPEFYTRAEDVVLFWDGFSNFQAQHLMEYIGENVAAENARELRTEGYQLEIIDWNAVRNATMRALNNFFRLHGPSRAWHKVVTCQEAVRQKLKPGARIGDQPVVVDERRPMLAGQAGLLAGAGFDLIVETRVRNKQQRDEDDAPREYVYITEGSDLLYAKKRGFELPSVMPANMAELWTAVTRQLGIPLPKEEKNE